MTPQKLEEKREKWICYSFDRKYTKGHKCIENKLFYIDYEADEEKEQTTSKGEDTHQEPTLEKEEMKLTISCNALAVIIAPQIVKIKGYTKKEKVIVLIDSGGTHNFIHCKIAKELNCFIYPTLEC